jgi:L-fuculose-phosphate aldolase
MNRQVVEGSGKPSVETPFHLAIYKARHDVNVILHSHPLNVIIFSLRGHPLQLLEVERGVNTVPIVEYKKPGSADLASAISRKIRTHNAVILAKHGLVTVGKTVADAYDLTEVIEMNAEIQNRLYFPSSNFPRRTLS